MSIDFDYGLGQTNIEWLKLCPSFTQHTHKHSMQKQEHEKEPHNMLSLMHGEIVI